MEKQIWDLDFNSDEEEITASLQELAQKQIGITERLSEKYAVSINYALQLLGFKQQQKILKEQRKGNRELAKYTLWLALATIGLALITAVIGLATTYYSYKTEKLADAKNSAQFLITFNSQLRNGSHSYSDLIYTIATEQKLNNFSDEEIDNYLVQWDLIDDLVQKGLVEQGSAYDMFSYDVEAAYCSPYIKKFVSEVRDASSADDNDYTGFTDLADKFLTQDSGVLCKPNQY